MENKDFAERNVGLVRALVPRFLGRGIEYDDLFQAGCEGLIKAAAHFDPDRGYKFSTYAVPVILGEMRRLFGEEKGETLYEKIENVCSEYLTRDTETSAD